MKSSTLSRTSNTTNKATSGAGVVVTARVAAITAGEEAIGEVAEAAVKAGEEAAVAAPEGNRLRNNAYYVAR